MRAYVVIVFIVITVSTPLIFAILHVQSFSNCKLFEGWQLGPYDFHMCKSFISSRNDTTSSGIESRKPCHHLLDQPNNHPSTNYQLNNVHRAYRSLALATNQLEHVPKISLEKDWTNTGGGGGRHHLDGKSVFSAEFPCSTLESWIPVVFSFPPPLTHSLTHSFSIVGFIP